MHNIAIIGKGKWGSALGAAFLRASHHVTMVEKGSNNDDLHKANIIVVATPSLVFGDVIDELKKLALAQSTILIIASKGVDNNTGSLFSNIASQYLPCKIGVISGPNFASEVSEGKFTATNLAIKDDYTLARKIATDLSSPSFRVVASNNIEALQIAGCMKNIMAIWAGIAHGLNWQRNAISYLLTLGFQEIEILIAQISTQETRLSKLAIFGDYYLTTSSSESRNYQFGVDLANNDGPVVKFIQDYHSLVEGCFAVGGVLKLAGGTNLPLTRLLLQVLEGNCSLKDATHKILYEL